jgi:hypothetical protein
VLLFFARVLFLVIGNFFAVVVLLLVADFFAIAVFLGVAAFLAVATGAFLEVLALGVGLAEAAKAGVAARQIIAVRAIANLRNFTV